MSKNIVWILIILTAAAGLIFLGNRRVNDNGQDVTQMCVQHFNLGMHIHPHLKIVVGGEEQTIPADIGIVSPTCYRPVHTHDSSGNLHLEFPQPRDVRLGEFFQIWGREFNREGVKMFVNGRENFEFENYIMRDLDEILIIYD